MTAAWALWAETAERGTVAQFDFTHGRQALGGKCELRAADRFRSGRCFAGWASSVESRRSAAYAVSCMYTPSRSNLARYGRRVMAEATACRASC